MSYDIERVVNNQTNGVLIFVGLVMAIRYKSRNRKRRYESDWMQDNKIGVLDEHPALAISRTLKDDYEDLFDTTSVKNDGRGKIVYDHAEDGGEDIIFESDGDYVIGYGELPTDFSQCVVHSSLGT